MPVLEPVDSFNRPILVMAIALTTTAGFVIVEIWRVKKLTRVRREKRQKRFLAGQTEQLHHSSSSANSSAPPPISKSVIGIPAMVDAPPVSELSAEVNASAGGSGTTVGSFAIGS
jgi:hypothetical protein